MAAIGLWRRGEEAALQAPGLVLIVMALFDAAKYVSKCPVAYREDMGHNGPL